MFEGRRPLRKSEASNRSSRHCLHNQAAAGFDPGHYGRVSLVWLLKETLRLTSLEVEFRPDLPDAWARGSKHSPKRTGAGVKVTIHIKRAIELSVVEDVEELRTKLQRLAFRQLHILQEGQVPVINSRPMKESLVGGPLLGETFPAEQRGVEIGVDEDAVAAQILLPRVLVNIDWAAPREIGRASCRERV